MKKIAILFFLISFNSNGQLWDEMIKNVAMDRKNGDWFGYSVSISGDYAIVGAVYNDTDENGENPLNAAGAAYLFQKI
jgi:hypothetical protein